MLFKSLTSGAKLVTGAKIIPLTESNIVSNVSKSDRDVLRYIQRRNGYPIWKYGVILPRGTVVYNANCTTDDKLFYNDEEQDGTMIDNWRKLVDDALETDQINDRYFRHLVEDETCPNEYCKGTKLSQICGAHVLLTKPEDLKPPRVGELVFIIPLCASCNNYHNKDAIFLSRDVPAITTIWTEISKQP